MNGRERLELLSQITPEELLDWLGCRLRAFHPELTDEQIMESLDHSKFTREKLMAHITQFYYFEATEWLNAPYLKPWKRPKASDPVCTVNHPAHRPGFVYIAEVGDLFKIGYTTSERYKPVEARLKNITLEKMLNERWKLVHAIKTNCAPGLERYLHNLNFQRMWGEFFRLTPHDLVFIKHIETFNEEPVEHFEKDFSQA